MRTFIVTATALTLLAGGHAALAQNANPAAAAEQHRIVQGVRSGAVTHGEAVKLEAQQHRIDATAVRERTANHGRLTLRQRRALLARQRAASQHIYNKKHNPVVR